jgi:hypothetical protein
LTLKSALFVNSNDNRTKLSPQGSVVWGQQSPIGNLNNYSQNNAFTPKLKRMRNKPSTSAGFNLGYQKHKNRTSTNEKQVFSTVINNITEETQRSKDSEEIQFILH